MAPKIGMTTNILSRDTWHKDLGAYEFDVIEIGNRRNLLYLNPAWIAKITPYLKDHDISLHSGTVIIFTDNAQFTKAELERLKAEVLLCEMIGAKQLIFHLKHDKLSEEEAAKLREVVDLSKEHGIDMIYESNGIVVADVALDFLRRFPDVGYNLDLGHLNNGLGRGMLGCELDKFINQIKDRVVYIHAHNNSGKKDEHKALDDGTLDWRHVLSMLDLSKVKKIIIEAKGKDAVISSKRDLDKFLGE